MAFITSEWKGKKIFDIDSFHHIEFFCGNAKQSSYYYRMVFGFDVIAYRGPETGHPESVSYVLKQNQIIFVLTSPIAENKKIRNWLSSHGDGVCNIAIKVNDAFDAYYKSCKNGAIGVTEPFTLSDADGLVSVSSIAAYGDVIHTFVEDESYNGVWMPGFEALSIDSNCHKSPDLLFIDHIVANVEDKKMDKWKSFYENVFGFSTFVKFDESDISTKYSSLKSVVVRSENWKVKLPINEPAQGLKKSQITEFLDFNNGPGVQHIAIQTEDIIGAIKSLRRNGVDFLEVPDRYYENLVDRIGNIQEDIEELKKNKILVDRDEEGYLLQLFTKPIQDSPTLFIEIIQRKGSRGFGQGNFQALFEAIEREQEKRGNL